MMVHCKDRSGPRGALFGKGPKGALPPVTATDPQIRACTCLDTMFYLAAHLDIQPYSGCRWHERWHWDISGQAQGRGLKQTLVVSKKGSSVLFCIAFQGTPERRLIGCPVWSSKSKHGVCRGVDEDWRTSSATHAAQRPDRPGRECHTPKRQKGTSNAITWARSQPNLSPEPCP